MAETIPSSSERVLLAIWTILTATVAITGNLVVLIAINRKCVKLDKFSVVFIGHLAVADICCGLYVITNFVNITSGHYILGEQNCYISVLICNYFFAVSSMFIGCLNMSKVTCLLFPFSARVRSSRSGNVIAAVVWISALPIFGFVVSLLDYYYFSLEQLRCSLVNTSSDSDTFKKAGYLFFVYVIIPGFVILVCTVGLLLYTCYKRIKLKSGTLATNLFLSVTFLISYFPVSLKYMLASHGISDVNFSRFSSYLTVLNFAINPIIYSVTIRSFGKFVRNFFNCYTFSLTYLNLGTDTYT